MHDEELWQLYNENGLPIRGKGTSKQIFKSNPALIMANAHIWFWRSTGTEIEIMLQKRSLQVTDRPSWYHISAGGHINVGETAVEAAVREAVEEMGLTIDPTELYFVYSMRTLPMDPRSFVHVFLYRLNGDEQISHVDGEVESFEWRTLDEWKAMTAAPEQHRLVPQGETRFSLLTTALEYVATTI